MRFVKVLLSLKQAAPQTNLMAILERKVVFVNN